MKDPIKNMEHTLKVNIDFISKETKDFIEVEIPEGKREEYNLEGFDKCGDGESEKDGVKTYFEYFIKHKKDAKLGVTD